MPEHIIGPSQVVWGINSSGVAPVYISGGISVHSEPVGFDGNEQLTFLTGSPSHTTGVFSSGLVETIVVKSSVDAFISFDKTPTVDSFFVNAGASVSADLKVGSVMVLAKGSIGSVWVWGGR